MADPARREVILRAAERLLAHYGPAKTTVGDIAREVGIGVGSVYLEFESKEAIVHELAERRHARVLGAMRAAATERRKPAEKLRAMLEVRVVTLLELADGGTHACDLVLCPSTAVQSAHGRFRTEELALIREVLEEGARSGELSVADSGRTADLIQRALATFSPPALFRQPKSDVVTLLGEMCGLLLDGLRSRAARQSRGR